MRFLVFGAGAIGSVFGGLLAKSGHLVTLIGRKAHMEAIAHSGLVIDGIWGRHVIRDNITPATELTPELLFHSPAFDLCLLTVKSYDTADAMRMICNVFPEPPKVLSLQNGLGNIETISRFIGPSKTIGGRVIFGVEYQIPGLVTVTVAADSTKIGSVSNCIPRHEIEHLASVLTQAGIPTEATDDINRYIWSKILYNCSLNPLATLLNVHYGKLLSNSAARAIMQEIITEIFTVARHLSIKLDWDSPEQYAEVLFGELIPKTFQHHPSMLQDVQHGKRTEIDALNGAIAEYAKRLGCEAPMNALMRDLIKAKESLCHQTGTTTR